MPTTTMADVDEQLCYFGPDEALFGCYHATATPSPRPHGVVLCYPLDPEYLRAHRAFRQLAVRLARAGVPTLRFDYTGSGDSRGRSGEAWIDDWIRDVHVAVDALRDRSQAETFTLVGLRLGATIAAEAATGREDVTGLALWEPIVDGGEYVAQLQELDAKPLWRTVEPPTDDMDLDAELRGWPVTREMLLRLERIDLTALERIPAPRTLVVHGGRAPGTVALVRQLTALGVAVTDAAMESPAIWDVQGGTLLPTKVLKRIADWIGTTD